MILERRLTGHLPLFLSYKLAKISLMTWSRKKRIRTLYLMTAKPPYLAIRSLHFMLKPIINMFSLSWVYFLAMDIKKPEKQKRNKKKTIGWIFWTFFLPENSTVQNGDTTNYLLWLPGPKNTRIKDRWEREREDAFRFYLFFRIQEQKSVENVLCVQKISVFHT